MTDLAALEQTILDLVSGLEPGKTIAPADAAQKLAGKSSEAWGPLMQPLRRIAVRLAKEGRIVIYRKGRAGRPGRFQRHLSPWTAAAGLTVAPDATA